MSDVEFYQRLYRYDRQVIENFLRKLERMPLKEATRNRGIGHLSLARTLIHVIRVHDAWLNYLAAGDIEGLRASHKIFLKLRTPSEARRYFRETWKGVDARIKKLTPKELRRSASAPWMPGRYTQADVLLQCSFEQAHHLGEVIGAMWQKDLVPPQMMWIPVVTGKRVPVA